MSAVAAIPQPITAATATIMIVEDTPFWQKQIAQSLQAAGYLTVLANNGLEALELLKTHKPGLIVSDVEMPEMTGLELLKALRAMPQWQRLPLILLTTGAMKERVLEATRLRAAEYMLKGAFSADQLAERVKKWLNQSKTPSPAGAKAPVASAFPRLLQRGQVLSAIAARAAAGKTLAAVAEKTAELCKSSPNNPTALAEIVKYDPIFAMRALQQSNATKRVGTIEEAVRVIGCEGIQTIAQSLDAYPTGSRTALLRWQHSVAVASVMHKIVPRSFELSVGIAYLIGLLHDLPEILLQEAFPAEFGAAADFADQAGRTLRQIMPDVFSVSISDVANELFTLLKLPPLIATPLQEYAASTELVGRGGSKSAPIVDRLALALRFAEYYANALQLTSTHADAFISPLSLAECRSAFVAADELNGADIRAQTINATRALAGEEPEVPVTSSAPLRLWYVRHISFAALDPVEQALKQFAEVQTHPEPPSKREHFEDVDGVVVSAPALDTFGLLWCAPDRMLQQRGGSSRILFILPIAGGKDAKHSMGDDVNILRYPFSLPALEQAVGLFKQR